MIEVYSQIVDEDMWESFNIDEMAKSAVNLIESCSEIGNDKEISIIFTNNTMVQELNNTYRNKNKPTNVLSFAFNDDGSDNVMLGEIFLAYNIIENEAIEQGKTFNNHCMHIIIHGILHLLGYDHEIEPDAEEMEKIEIELLHKINIENPYKGV